MHKTTYKFWNYIWSRALEFNHGSWNISIQDILCHFSNRYDESQKKWSNNSYIVIKKITVNPNFYILQKISINKKVKIQKTFSDKNNFSSTTQEDEYIDLIVTSTTTEYTFFPNHMECLQKNVCCSKKPPSIHVKVLKSFREKYF